MSTMRLVSLSVGRYRIDLKMIRYKRLERDFIYNLRSSHTPSEVDTQRAADGHSQGRRFPANIILCRRITVAAGTAHKVQRTPPQPPPTCVIHFHSIILYARTHNNIILLYDAHRQRLPVRRCRHTTMTIGEKGGPRWTRMYPSIDESRGKMPTHLFTRNILLQFN